MTVNDELIKINQWFSAKQATTKRRKIQVFIVPQIREISFHCSTASFLIHQR